MTMTRWIPLVFSCGLLGAACGGDDDGTEDAADDAADDVADDAADSAADTATAGTADDAADDAVDDAADDGVESGDTDVASTGGATEGGGDACIPEATDDACVTCTKTSCCEEVVACNADPICVCMQGCVGGVNDIAPCTEECGMNTTFGPLTTCAATNCAADCL